MNGLQVVPQHILDALPQTDKRRKTERPQAARIGEVSRDVRFASRYPFDLNRILNADGRQCRIQEPLYRGFGSGCDVVSCAGQTAGRE